MPTTMQWINIVHSRVVHSSANRWFASTCGTNSASDSSLGYNSWTQKNIILSCQQRLPALRIIQCTESTEMSHFIHAVQRGGGAGDRKGTGEGRGNPRVPFTWVLIWWVCSVVRGQQAVPWRHMQTLLWMYSSILFFKALFILKVQLKTHHFHEPWKYPTAVFHFLIIKNSSRYFRHIRFSVSVRI